MMFLLWTVVVVVTVDVAAVVVNVFNMFFKYVFKYLFLICCFTLSLTCLFSFGATSTLIVLKLICLFCGIGVKQVAHILS